MKRFFTSDQRGMGHLGLIAVVVVVLGLAGAGYFVYSKNRDSNTNTALKNAKCDYNDKDLCKFFTSFKAQRYVTTEITHESNGQKNISTIQRDGDTKTHVKTQGSFTHEVITIGSTTYTKAGNTWWKQTAQSSNAQDLEDAKPDIKEPEGTMADKVSFKKLGKEACGKLTCFKYQQFDTTAAAGTYFLWFDDTEYQLRRTHSEGQGYKEDATYSYEKVDIKEPSPVKELGANQYIVPGQTEPTTLPATGDLPLYE